MWLMVTVLHRAGLDSPQMCSKSLNSSLVVVHRYPPRLHSHFSQFLPNTLGCNEILHSSKSPRVLPWDIKSFGLKQLSSICLANSYFAFGAQLSSHYPYLRPGAISTLLLPLPDMPPKGLIAHTEHLSHWVLVPSLSIFPIRLHSEVKDPGSFAAVVFSAPAQYLVCTYSASAHSARSSGPRSRAPWQHFLCTPHWRQSTGNVTDTWMCHSKSLKQGVTERYLFTHYPGFSDPLSNRFRKTVIQLFC